MKKNTTSQSHLVQTQEEIRRIRTLLLKEDHQVYLCVTSSFHQSINTVVEGIASSFALTQKKVAIVNLNFRQSNAYDFSDNINGIEHYFTDQSTLDECRLTYEPNLDVFANKSVIHYSSDVLESSKLSVLIQELRRMYDYVFMMTASLSDNYDVLIVGEHVDGLIYAKQQVDVTLAQVTQHASLLQRLNKPVVGLIMTQMQRY